MTNLNALSITLNKTTSKGASMTNRYTHPSNLRAPETTTWTKTMQASQNIDTLHGRIIDTGVNFIVSGFNPSGAWQEIPCQNLKTARLYLGQIMSQLDWELARINNKS